MVSCIDYYVKKTIKLGIYMYVFILYTYVCLCYEQTSNLHILKHCIISNVAQ